MPCKTFDGPSQALGQGDIYLMDPRECWIELMGKLHNGWLHPHPAAHAHEILEWFLLGGTFKIISFQSLCHRQGCVLQGKLGLVKIQGFHQKCHSDNLSFTFILFWISLLPVLPNQNLKLSRETFSMDRHIYIYSCGAWALCLESVL